MQLARCGAHRVFGYHIADPAQFPRSGCLLQNSCVLCYPCPHLFGVRGFIPAGSTASTPLSRADKRLPNCFLISSLSTRFCLIAASGQQAAYCATLSPLCEACLILRPHAPPFLVSLGSSSSGQKMLPLHLILPGLSRNEAQDPTPNLSLTLPEQDLLLWALRLQCEGHPS
jgi:hypothetical protein